MTRGTGWRFAATKAALAALLIVPALGACADDDDDAAGLDEASAGDGNSAPSGDAGGGESTGDGADVASPNAQPISQETDAEDRQVIYTADLVVRVADVERATDQAVALAEDAGGLLFEQRSDLEGDQETDLVLKVPPDELDGFLAALVDLGTQLRRDLQAEDVTDQVVDLDGRLASARASADRLRSLLAEATTSTALVEIEAELARRESEIESLQGQLRVLTSQVELATVNVQLTERADLEVSDDLPGFVAGLKTGWVALVTVVLVLVVGVGFLLPFAPIAGGAWWIVHRVQRSRRPSAVPRPPSAPTPAPSD